MNSKFYRALIAKTPPTHPSQSVYARELKRCLARERAARAQQTLQDQAYIYRNSHVEQPVVESTTSEDKPDANSDS